MNYFFKEGKVRQDSLPDMTWLSGQAQDLEDRFLGLQMKMQRLYLKDLQRIERLCTYLNVLQPGDKIVQKLRAMQIKHIRPLIGQIKVSVVPHFLFPPEITQRGRHSLPVYCCPEMMSCLQISVCPFCGYKELALSAGPKSCHHPAAIGPSFKDEQNSSSIPEGAEHKPQRITAFKH